MTALCLDARRNAAAGGQVPPICGLAAAPSAPVLTAEDVARAFRRLPLYRGSIRTDPGGWTLVNLDTWFWCADAAGRSCAEIGQAERTVMLLGRQVRIRPRIVDYRWGFGDGTTATTTGARVRHVYRGRTTAAVTLTLTWSADYSVGRGPFLPIAGTTTTSGPPLALPVREARPVLVGG
jgi:hypothetical protein